MNVKKGASDVRCDLYLDLTTLKCPKALIELKLSFSSLDAGECLFLEMNPRYNNRDILAFLDTSQCCIQKVINEENTCAMLVSKS